MWKVEVIARLGLPPNAQRAVARPRDDPIVPQESKRLHSVAMAFEDRIQAAHCGWDGRTDGNVNRQGMGGTLLGGSVLCAEQRGRVGVADAPGESRDGTMGRNQVQELRHPSHSSTSALRRVKEAECRREETRRGSDVRKRTLRARMSGG